MVRRDVRPCYTVRRGR